MDDTGTTVVRREVLAPEPAEALAGMLDIDILDGAELPALWHWVYLLERRPHRDLGLEQMRKLVVREGCYSRERRFIG